MKILFKYRFGIKQPAIIKHKYLYKVAFRLITPAFFYQMDE